MKSVLARVVAGVSMLAVILGLVVGLAGPAGAGQTAAAPSRATLKAAAVKVVTEKVGGSLYGHYKDKYPKKLNWTNDGCSVPKEVAAWPQMFAVLKAYGKVFEKSCDRHDFGYRNFGKNTTTPGVHHKFQPTEARKAQIDKKFYGNMKVQCEKKFWGPAEDFCKGGAWTFYQAVKHGADDAFFG